MMSGSTTLLDSAKRVVESWLPFRQPVGEGEALMGITRPADTASLRLACITITGNLE